MKLKGILFLNLKIFEGGFCYVKREECVNFFVDRLRKRVVVMFCVFKKIEGWRNLL